MPPSKVHLPPKQDSNEADVAKLLPLCVDRSQALHTRTFTFALNYLRMLRKVATLDAVKLPSKPEYVCAFLASEQLQNGIVLGYQAIEARDSTKHNSFWKATVVVESLLSRAAAEVNTFDYICLPTWTPKCRRCTSQGLPCLQTTCIVPEGTVHPDVHQCQACYARGVACHFEKQTKVSVRVPTKTPLSSLAVSQQAADHSMSLLDPVGSQMLREALCLCESTSSQYVQTPRSPERVHNSSASTPRNLDLPQLVQPQHDDDDDDDDIPLKISFKLRRRSIEGAERDRANKKRCVVSVASPTPKVNPAAKSGAIQILPPLPSTHATWTPSRVEHHTPIASSSRPPRTTSLAVSPTPTPSSLSDATCIGPSFVDANWVTSLCDRLREIANYVHGHGCEDYQLRTLISDAVCRKKVKALSSDLS
ncbi:hypothetical protein PHLGIDRAFT_123637 [Phlebiopsis gigantea 11061_1 CR5-6]|uniref:Uncharacterized protein n=1 Tax=Phlebiopsis gigantea (strain 11061_1 CR5-6) TaxID=745531 RepID=A0A0C3RYA6_PHLG1|nr:hypothetical protein PHLGIDRAFT_123637 [Phlebiopsis gigantea 11061_1 CR5-6]